MQTLQQRWNARHTPEDWSSLSRDELIAFCEEELARAASRPTSPGHVALTHPQWKIVPVEPTVEQLTRAGFLPTATSIYHDMLAGAPDVPREVILASRELLDNGQVWLSPDTAPRDGTLFLGDIGYPWPLMMGWSQTEQGWVVAMLAMNVYDGQDDPYFENEWEPVESLKRWRPMPRIPEPIPDND